MKYKYLIACLILCFTLLSSACVAYGYDESPLYATLSFNSETKTHRFSTYNGDEYFYYDNAGQKGPGVYRTKDWKESKYLSQVYPPWIFGQMMANAAYLYIGVGRMEEIRLRDSSVRTTPEKYYIRSFYLRDDDVFAPGHEYIDGPVHAERAYSLYSFHAGQIDQTPETHRALGTGDSKLEFGEYAIEQENEFEYIFVGRGDECQGLAGIYDENNGVIAFGEKGEPYPREQSVIFINESEMIMANWWRNCYLSRYRDGAYEEEFVVFKDGYKIDPNGENNIIIEDDKMYFLLHNAPNINVLGMYNLRQRFSYHDALVSVDMNTGEVNTLYKTKNNKVRIIGYEDGQIYLFREKGKTIYRMDEKTGKPSEFVKLKEYRNYAFEMCGEKLLVWGSDGKDDPVNFIGAYNR